jgi:NAD dependent epimerase/dehydratase family enzyme
VKLGCFVIGSASELALQSRKVRSQKLDDAGYFFRFPTLQSAVADLVDC